MYPNLDAEQARRKLNNSETASAIGLTRAAYERKKKNGRFLAEECCGLCRLFNAPFEYLFSRDTETESNQSA